MEKTKCRLGDLLVNFDYLRKPLSSIERGEIQGDYPYYGAQGIIDHIDRYSIEGRYLLIAEDGENLSSRKEPIALFADGQYWVNNHAHIVRTNDLADIDYIMYALNHLDISGYVTGSAQPKLSQGNLNKITLMLPSLPTQQKIASILSAYDSYIENNRKRIKLLEQMAENLYKEWFVRFRFPGYESAEFEGGVPRGWSVERMRNVAKISAGGDAPKDMSETYSEAYPFPIYSNGIKDEGLYGYCKRFTIPENTITVSARGTVGYVAYREEPFLPIVRLISIHSFKKGISPYWLFFCLRNDSIDGYGTSQQQITVPFFEKKKVIVPSQNVQMLFENQISPIYSERRHLKKQIKLLTTQRDLLLPRLMSGKLSI